MDDLDKDDYLPVSGSSGVPQSPSLNYSGSRNHHSGSPGSSKHSSGSHASSANSSSLKAKILDNGNGDSAGAGPAASGVVFERTYEDGDITESPTRQEVREILKMSIPLVITFGLDYLPGFVRFAFASFLKAARAFVFGVLWCVC